MPEMEEKREKMSIKGLREPLRPGERSTVPAPLQFLSWGGRQKGGSGVAGGWGGSQCCSSHLWVTVGLSPHWDVTVFHRSWLVPSLFPCSSSVLQSQLDPLVPAGSWFPARCWFPAHSLVPSLQQGRTAGGRQFFLQSSFRFPRWTFEASGITISASL